MSTSMTTTVQALIANLDEARLRVFVSDVVAALLRCVMAEPVAVPLSGTPISGRRQWSEARRAAENAKRREKRRATVGGNGRRRRRRRDAGERAPTEPSAVPGRNGRGAVTAERLWQHARSLAPEQPWQAVCREFRI